ncbi:HPr kinase/phosphatase C-terminal domain-containing protein [Geminicoccaceae bacterium 1502E]|nr:HPr kinase/phosphatase C-terminal domain-containing protein [Geminicoccaceae bacterium 1502E]
MPKATPAPVLRHATCVAWLEHGLLLCGPSGSGKSELALRLMEAGALLVADDQVLIERRGDRLHARAPALPGHIELRGQGVYRVAWRAETVLHLAVYLEHEGYAERLPEPRIDTILGAGLPAVGLDPRPASAVARLRIVLTGTRVA